MIGMRDGPQSAQSSDQRSEAGRETTTWRRFRWLTGLVPLIVVAACASADMTAGQQGHNYRDPAWTVEAPSGWHTVRFSDAKNGVTSAGMQVSNVKLSAPVLRLGFPVQTSAVMPLDGAALVIASDPDPSVHHYGRLAVPPLPVFSSPNGWKYWNAGSSIGNNPDIASIWFRAHGRTFIATMKFGVKATSSDRRAIDAIIQSLR